MNPVRELRRLLNNTDRVAAGVESLVDNGVPILRQAVDNVTDNMNERTDRLQQGINNLARDVNRKLDRLIASAAAQRSAGNSVGNDVGPIKRRAARGQSVAEWLRLPSPTALPLPRWSGTAVGLPSAPRVAKTSNALNTYQPLLDALGPWSGSVPKGFLVDFLGILTDANFRTQFGVDPAKAGGTYTATEIPPIEGGNGEWWFEVVNWFEAAREAHDRFVMITLGANYGAQAVGAHRALQIVNPMPCKLVAVEPVPENYLWVRKHFKDNGIDPDDHWLVPAAISDTNQPVFFPIGAPGSGANNCMSTDTLDERNALANDLIDGGKAAEVLRNLMLYNTTGIMKDLLPEKELTGEIELVSAVTLQDLLSPFEVVDYVEADIQQSEVRVFPPFLDLLKKKVRRIHIGTHGKDTHELLYNAFSAGGWEIVFSYPPEDSYDSALGRFELNDGVLTVRNTDL